MQTAVKIPLKALDPSDVRDLQSKYPDAELHIVTADTPSEAEVMNEDRFWQIVDTLDWSKAGNNDAVIEPAVKELSRLPESAILSFYDLLSEKLYLLDGRDYATHSVSETDSISSDLFLYARCCVIANGRAFFEEVRQRPELFPKYVYFEALLNIPDHAWLRKNGRMLDHQPKFIYETGFNPNGWGADTIYL